MEITSIIKYPILTEKTYLQMQDNIYTFAVDKRATKFDVKRAVEFIFQVKVESVNTFNVPRKEKRVGRYTGFVAGYKKAIIKLSEGKIQILPEEGVANEVKEKETEEKVVKAKVKEISDAEKKAKEKIEKASSKTVETKVEETKEDK